MRQQWLVTALGALLLAWPARGVVLRAGDVLIADPSLPGVIRIDPTTGDQTIVAQGELIGADNDFPQGIVADLALQRIYLGKYGAIGLPLNLASRIESCTFGGEILISERVLEASHGEPCVDLVREIHPKGFEEALRVHRVVGIRGRSFVNSRCRPRASSARSRSRK